MHTNLPCPLPLQEFFTNTADSSTAAAAGSSSAAVKRSTGTTNSSSNSTVVKLDRRSALLAAADVLLSCAVHGGSMAGSADKRVVQDAHAAILTAAERCGLSVPEEPVSGAVAPPIKPPEQSQWLKLAAHSLKLAGWRLQAGQLLLGLGPDADGGNFWRAARKILREADDKAEVAKIYEQAARQELQLTTAGGTSHGGSSADAPGSSTQGDKDAAGAMLVEAAGAAVPKGLLGGSFLSASRLLHDAYKLHLALGRYGECRRLLMQYEGLKPLLKPREVDEFTLVGVS